MTTLGLKGKWSTKGHKGHHVAINVGAKNAMWKGDAVGKLALHEWVRNHLPQPNYCEACNVKAPFDLACVTGIYSRELSNWQYLCRTCHMKSDGRLDLIHRSRPAWNKGKKAGTR